MKGAGRIRTPGSVAVKVQSGRRTAVQSIVGLGSREICVDSTVKVGDGVAVEVGVIVELVVMLGVMLAVAVAVAGSWVQVEGRMTFVPVGAGLFVGRRAVASRGTQPTKTIRKRIIKEKRQYPRRPRNRLSLQTQAFLTTFIIHPVSEKGSPCYAESYSNSIMKEGLSKEKT